VRFEEGPDAFGDYAREKLFVSRQICCHDKVSGFPILMTSQKNFMDFLTAFASKKVRMLLAITHVKSYLFRARFAVTTKCLD
ncbi:hypothetical protein, partial [Corynebacterium diphtheriae]|uniref:hypothetical protein n=1 Tax=Corynebacterium diphtheriae TaxID=1717 RepID=UPI001C7D9719